MKRRILRSLFTVATCDRRPSRDEVLHTEPIPKLMLMPMTWRGDLRPVLDAYLDQLEPLTNGLALGRVLHAEEIPRALNMGTLWLGSFRDRMLGAHNDKAGALDATELLRQVEAVRREMGTGSPAAVADGLRRLRRAADGLTSARDEERHGAFSEGKRIADAARRRIADINADNREFHAARSGTPQLDSSGRMNWRTGDGSAPSARTAVRDALHAANHATTARDLIRAKNAAARAFWANP